MHGQHQETPAEGPCAALEPAASWQSLVWVGKHTAGPASGAGDCPLQPPMHVAAVMLLPSPAPAGAKAPQCEPAHLNQYLPSENNISPLSISVPVMSSTLFTSTWKENTNIQAVSDFPNAIPSPATCLICQGLVAVNLKLLCFPAMLFYSYLHHFIRNISAPKKSDDMTDIFELQLQQPHENTEKKNATFFLIKKVDFLNPLGLQRVGGGIPPLPPMCRVRHPPRRPGKKHRWWEEDALQQDEGGCVEHERSAKATGAWLFPAWSWSCLSP